MRKTQRPERKEKEMDVSLIKKTQTMIRKKNKKMDDS